MIPRRLLVAIALLLATISGLGFYAWHLLERVRDTNPVAGDNRPVPPPVGGPTVSVQLFVASDEDGRLHPEDVSIPLPEDPTKRAREILHALIARYQENGSLHPIGAGADVTDVYLVNGSLAVVNANAAFANSHPTGILSEELTMASMAQTLAANVPAITQIKLLVDGKERATLAGHAELSEPYNVNEARLLVK